MSAADVPVRLNRAGQSRQRPRSAFPLLVGLLLFELIGWSALHYELDQQLGIGGRFWGVVVLATGGLIMLWLSVRVLFVRRGWFTLKEFLVFVLLVGAACGVAGKIYRQTLKQRQIAELLTEQGAGVSLHGRDEPGFQRWIGSEYFHGVGSVEFFERQLAAEDMTVLRGLPELQRLTLVGQKLSDDHLQYINELPALTTLWVGGRDVTNSGLAHLRGNRRLQDLTLSTPNVGDDGLAHLTTIANLKALTLMDMPITDVGLARLGRCTQLETLQLTGVNITDAGLAHLAALARLERLTIDSAGVSDAGLAHLARIPSLKSLDLASPQVTDAGIDYLEQFPQLTTLRLYRAQVSLERMVRLKQSRPALQVWP